MINKTLLVALVSAVLLSACAQSPSVKRSEYRLPVLNQPFDTLCSAEARHVMVSDLMLSSGILLQQSRTTVQAARYHRWNGSLEQQLQQSAQRQLSEPHCEGTVTINVTDFWGDNKGNALVAGHWVYSNGDDVLQGAFYKKQPLQHDGYASLVEALNQGWLSALNDVKSAIPN